MVMSGRSVQALSVAIPNLVSTVLSTRNDQIGNQTPIDLENDPVVSFPLNRRVEH